MIQNNENKPIKIVHRFNRQNRSIFGRRIDRVKYYHISFFYTCILGLLLLMSI